MRKSSNELLCVSLLIVAAILTAWLGIAGPFVSEASAEGIYLFLKDWQTLISALIAMAAALIAVKPVRDQLSEMRRQSMRADHQRFSSRSVALHKEREALYEITSAIDIMANALATIPVQPQVGGLMAHQVATLEGSERHLRETVARFKRDLGPVWGDIAIQKARSKMLDETLRFCNELTKTMSLISVGSPILLADLNVSLPLLMNYKKQVFTSAQILHTGIEAETIRTGEFIASIERSLT